MCLRMLMEGANIWSVERLTGVNRPSRRDPVQLREEAGWKPALRVFAHASRYKNHRPTSRYVTSNMRHAMNASPMYVAAMRTPSEAGFPRSFS